MSISAADVKKLRERTNAPMKDCKSALEKANGDMEKAIEELRLIGVAAGAKKAANETAEGRIGIYIDADKQIGGIVEVLCQTAPSAKNELFVKLCADLAKHCALKGPGSNTEMLEQKFVDDESKTVNDRIVEVVSLIRENMRLGRVCKLEGILGEYVHHDGSVGVLLKVQGDKPSSPAILRDVCMHVAAVRPVSATVDEVDPKLLETEKRIATEQAKATGKPDNIVEKIAEGKLKSWYKDNVLSEQPFVKDETKTVGELLKGAGLKLATFTCFKVGEGASTAAEASK